MQANYLPQTLHNSGVVLGAGAPAFLKHVPLLGGALRGICVRAVKRMVEASRHPCFTDIPRHAPQTWKPAQARLIMYFACSMPGVAGPA